jgi:glycine/D-amino acid oxidase-like deaminating enzyme
VVRISGPPTTPVPATQRSFGIVAAGGHDSPSRLAHAVGEAEAQALWSFSRRSTQRLLALDPGAVRGVWRIALQSGENEEWQDSCRLIEGWEANPGLRSADGAELARLGVGSGFAGGVRVADDGCVDLTVVRRHLDGLATDQDLDILSGSATITTIDGQGVRLDRGPSLPPVLAEIVIVAAGIGSRTVHPFFEDLLYPVRLQARRSAAGLENGPRFDACVARHRHEAWCPTPDGGLDFTGCRWAEQPEMEAGVVDDVAISERVGGKQDGFIEQHLAGNPRASGGVTARWTGIANYSCDGLPLVGPVPGSPRVLALTGWCGWGLSWIGESVEAVSAAVLGETGGVEPAPLLAPRRML